MISLESSELRLTWLTRSVYDHHCESSTTLSKSEKGLPPEFEFVGVPSMIRKEKGKLHKIITCKKSNVLYIVYM